MRREKTLEFVVAAAAGQRSGRRQRNRFVGIVERALQQIDARGILHRGDREDEVDALRRGELGVLRGNEVVCRLLFPAKGTRERRRKFREPPLGDRVQRRDDRVERGIERGIFVVLQRVDEIV